MNCIIVDTVLDDCFQLISLFFLTIGRNQEAPAVYVAMRYHYIYSVLTRLDQIFRHLDSKGSRYRQPDIQSFRDTNHLHSASWTISKKPASTRPRISTQLHIIFSNGANQSNEARRTTVLA